MRSSLGVQSLLALLLVLFSSTKSVSSQTTSIEYIKSSCNSTTYPRLCYRSLSIYAQKIQTDPKTMANTALNITLKATKATSRMIFKISRQHGLVPKETAAAIADCVEVISDSVDELQQSLHELGHIRSSNFDLTMSDIQTWVSAALTDSDTCMDELKGMPMDSRLRNLIKRHIVRLEHYTSNALALINRYAAENVKNTLP